MKKRRSFRSSRNFEMPSVMQLKKRDRSRADKCSFSPMLTSKAKELGAKKAELVLLPFDPKKEQKAVREAFASMGGPPAPPFTLRKGDQVEIIDRRIGLNGKWCLGRVPRGLESRKGKTTTKGVFPRWCIGEHSLFHRMHQEMEHIEDRRSAKAEKLRNEREEEFTVSLEILLSTPSFLPYLFLLNASSHMPCKHYTPTVPPKNQPQEKSENAQRV